MCRRHRWSLWLPCAVNPLRYRYQRSPSSITSHSSTLPNLFHRWSLYLLRHWSSLMCHCQQSLSYRQSANYSRYISLNVSFSSLSFWSVVLGRFGQTSQKEAAAFNSKAMNAIFNTISMEEFKRISNVEIAYTAWNILQTVLEGMKA